MSEVIVPTLEKIVSEILENGVYIGNTKEAQNIKFQWCLHPDSWSWPQEEATLDLFYKEHGLDLEEKVKEEEYHYKFLKYSLLQKIRAVKYFHNQGVESRKLVIFSEDCIAMMQWLSRPQCETNFLNVYIRSSDALGLLGCDLLYIQNTALEIIREHHEIASFKTLIDVHIASCHIYICPETGKVVTRDGVETTLPCQ